MNIVKGLGVPRDVWILIFRCAMDMMTPLRGGWVTCACLRLTCKRFAALLTQKDVREALQGDLERLPIHKLVSNRWVTETGLYVRHFRLLIGPSHLERKLEELDIYFNGGREFVISTLITPGLLLHSNTVRVIEMVGKNHRSNDLGITWTVLKRFAFEGTSWLQSTSPFDQGAIESSKLSIETMATTAFHPLCLRYIKSVYC